MMRLYWITPIDPKGKDRCLFEEGRERFLSNRENSVTRGQRKN